MTQISVYMLYGKIFFGFVCRHVYIHILNGLLASNSTTLYNYLKAGSCSPEMAAGVETRQPGADSWYWCDGRCWREEG